MTTHSNQDTHEHPGLEEPRPGHELRTARERAGISRESIAERLRLASDQLDALEHDDYSELPPPAFVRGYFRAYARELGLDPDEYIAAYNRSGVSATDPEIRRGGVTDTSSGGRGGLIGLLLIALVAAGGIGAWWYQQRMGNGDSGAADSVDEGSTAAGDSGTDADRPDTAGGDTDADETAAAVQGTSDETALVGGDTEAATPSADVAAADATVAAAEESDQDAADDESEQSVVAAMDPESSESDGEGGAGEGTEATDAGATDAGAADAENAGRTEENADDTAAAEKADNDAGADSTADAAEPGATSPAATDSPTRAATDAARTGPDQITLEFSSRSWLEVYDDRDRELVYTLYFGSEPITLQGWAPFEIFLGNSPAVTVQFNGEAIDKAAFTRSNNTARFVVDASGVRAP